MNGLIRLLFVGDVVGPTGCEAVAAFVPALRRELALDAVVANGENSADNGFGASARSAAALLEVVDFLTLGDHAFDQPDLAPMLDRDPRIIRPANFEGQHPGGGWGTFTVAGVMIGVANLLGKVFMRPAVTSAAAGCRSGDPGATSCWCKRNPGGHSGRGHQREAGDGLVPGGPRLGGPRLGGPRHPHSCAYR